MALFLITAPSGAGKTSVMEQVVRLIGERELGECKSHTSRKIRKGEVEGETYYYVDSVKFGDMIENEEFAECVRYDGNSYGITISEIERVMKEKRNAYIILNHDGYKQVKVVFPDAVGIFLHMSKEDCMANMLLRGDRLCDAVSRIELYDDEMKNRADFDYVIKNVRNKKAQTADIIKGIIRQHC